ncbi:putative DNA recombination mediator protein A [Xanthomonas phage FoX4]|uniref:Putative DNA recombination mediator protein A n=1 Tax=Xanthomonas phage FoX4 TaxID=2723900 RepID=A0A858WHQ8_9CAUD|nr:DprA-like DNA recombination-mediator protein [Xanthomonas phage FoX4]QJI53004.1 putative DNA recombination mediator protein A [Xanthomonas phage FoX4]
MRYYAGIGSRDTPHWVQLQMEKLAFVLARTHGMCLRSGAAIGADQAFERGARRYRLAECEIYLPWPGYEGHSSPRNEVDLSAMRVAMNLYPGNGWQTLGYKARLLHGRNVYQILGKDLETPVDMVVCWTPGGKSGGGTGGAIRVARSRGIPVHDWGKLTSPQIERFIEEWRYGRGS